MGNASSAERTTTLSRDTYLFVTEDVVDRLRSSSAENRQVGLATDEPQKPQQQQQPAASPTLSESVADSIRQTQLIDRLQKEYEERLAQLEDRSQHRFQSAAAQFSSAVNQVEAKFLDRQAMPPCCQAEKDAMARCYGANGRYPLRCSPAVAAFEQCVTEQRRAFVLGQRKAKGASEAA